MFFCVIRTNMGSNWLESSCKDLRRKGDGQANGADARNVLEGDPVGEEQRVAVARVLARPRLEVQLQV